MTQHDLNCGWQQADKRLDPTLVLTWVLGIGLAVFLVTTF
jgi:hypothetical protein